MVLKLRDMLPQNIVQLWATGFECAYCLVCVRIAHNELVFLSAVLGVTMHQCFPQ